MAITIPLLDEVIKQGISYWRNRFDGRDHSTEGFLGKTARACSMLVMGLLQSVEAADNDAVAGPNTSSAGLDDHAFALGLDNGEGGFGRKQPTPAAGGEGYCTGENATIFGAGLTLTASDETIVQLVAEKTIPGSPPGQGQILGSFVAITKGSAGNLPAGTVLTWDTTPAGADNTVTLTTALRDGTDLESDADLLERIYDRQQKPPKGGANPDYKSEWLEDVDGVDTAYVYPLRSGAGSVDNVLTAPGRGLARVPTVAVLNAARARLELERPNTANETNAFAPEMVASEVRVRLEAFGADWEFDWESGGVPVVVDSYSASPTPYIVTKTIEAPLSLRNAIDSNENPRIQLVVSGQLTPVVVVATSQIPFSGTTKIFLAAAASVAPAADDECYPGGPLVEPANEAILAYSDELGPSRESGKADDTEIWEDTLRINRIREAVLALRNADDRRMVEDVAAVTINGGTNDVAAEDRTPGLAPQLLYLSRVVVTD